MLASACTEATDDARRAVVINTLVEADEALLRSRPGLVEGKFQRMRSNLYSFYRGTFPLFLRDISDTTIPASETAFEARAFPVAVGDLHPENFGTLRASDGTYAVEPNDFDGADRYPYLYDLRRLTVGMVLAARLSNPEEPDLRALTAAEAPSIVRETALGYAETIRALADGAAPLRVSEDGGNPHFEDMFRRSVRDEEDRRELVQKTEIVNNLRRFKRGIWDEEDPNDQFAELPDLYADELPALLTRYRETLINPPPPEYFRVSDAVRQFGSGVASWPRVRVLILVRGPSDDTADDVILELKELVDSPAAGWLPPGNFYNSVPERVLQTSRSLWARPDAEPLWGADWFFGMPVQVKNETDSFKNLRLSRMEEERGTPESLRDLGRRLGSLVARTHAANDDRFPGTSEAIANTIYDDVNGFVDEQVRVSIAYADQVEADWKIFSDALDELGPRLGIPIEAIDRPNPEIEALYGTPPPFVTP